MNMYCLIDPDSSERSTVIQGDHHWLTLSAWLYWAVSSVKQEVRFCNFSTRGSCCYIRQLYYISLSILQSFIICDYKPSAHVQYRCVHFLPSVGNSRPQNWTRQRFSLNHPVEVIFHQKICARSTTGCLNCLIFILVHTHCTYCFPFLLFSSVSPALRINVPFYLVI